MTKKQKIKKHIEDNIDVYAFGLVAGSYVTLFGAAVWTIVKTTNAQIDDAQKERETRDETTSKYNEYLEAQITLTKAKADRLSGE